MSFITHLAVEQVHQLEEWDWSKIPVMVQEIYLCLQVVYAYTRSHIHIHILDTNPLKEGFQVVDAPWPGYVYFFSHVPKL